MELDGKWTDSFDVGTSAASRRCVVYFTHGDFLRIFDLFEAFAGICRRGANRTTADLIGVGCNYSLKNSVVRVMNVTVKGSPAGESFSLMAHHLHNYPATRERCVSVLGVRMVIRLAFL